MNIFTHLYMAVRLKKTIEASIPIRLKTVSFLLGCIKPDISPKFDSIRHYKKDSEEFLLEEIQSLLEDNIYEYEICRSGFSERLGIVVHYLSDFFCFAHTDEFTGNILEHHKYEMELFSCFLLNLKPFAKRYRNKTGEVGYNRNIAIRHNVSSISRYIDRLQEEYLKNEVNNLSLNDMDFIYTACVSLCFSVVTACLISEDSFSGLGNEVYL